MFRVVAQGALMVFEVLEGLVDLSFSWERSQGVLKFYDVLGFVGRC